MYRNFVYIALLCDCHVLFVVLEYVFQFVYIYVHFSVTSITLEIKTRVQCKHRTPYRSSGKVHTIAPHQLAYPIIPSEVTCAVKVNIFNQRNL